MAFFHRTKDFEHEIDQCEISSARVTIGDSRTFDEARGRIKLGQSMSWTRHELEQLWERVDKIQNLWHEEKQQGFAKMAENTHDRKGHAGIIAVRVTHKDTRGIPIVV